MPSFGPSPRFSKRLRLLTDAEASIASIKTCLDLFKVDCGRYPTTQEGLGALIKRPAAISETVWHGPYLAIDNFPNDPWGKPYRYEIPGQHHPDLYDVYSLGPNGKGGNESVGNWTPKR